MSGNPIKSNGKPALFEINLLGARAKTLRRRRAAQRVGIVMSLALIVVGGLFAIMAAVHLATGMRVGLGIRKVADELAAQQQLCRDMDALRYRALARIGPFTPLAPVVRRRIAWAPKLRALADALPPASGVLSINGSAGDLFKDANAKRRVGSKDPRARIDVAMLYAPASGSEEDPISLLDRLRENEPFMKKIDYIRLEATEESNWMGRPAVVLRSSGKGRLDP
jgi:hypothetical protein